MRVVDPQDILWAVAEIMGRDFVQGALNEFYSEINDGDINNDLLVMPSGVVVNWKTDVECTDDELLLFIDWCREQDF